MKAFTFVVSIILVCSLGFAKEWGANTPLVRKPEYKSAVGYDVVTADSVSSRNGLFTVRGCPDVIYVPIRSASIAADTLVFTESNCVRNSRFESVWLVSCNEIEDSTFQATSDVSYITWTQDTLFVKHSGAGSSVDYCYTLRIR